MSTFHANTPDAAAPTGSTALVLWKPRVPALLDAPDNFGFSEFDDRGLDELISRAEREDSKGSAFDIKGVVHAALDTGYPLYVQAVRQPAVARELAERIHRKSGGERKPSAKKPANLVTRWVTNPIGTAELKQASDWSYIFPYADRLGIRPDQFLAWLSSTSFQAARSAVRGTIKREVRLVCIKASTSDFPALAKAVGCKSGSDFFRIDHQGLMLIEEKLASHQGQPTS